MLKCYYCGSENDSKIEKCIICSNYLPIVMKVVLAGSPEADKSKLRERYLGSFQSKYQMTIGADFANKLMIVDKRPIKFHIWDITCQERFSKVRSVYYLGSSGGVVFFDVTKKDTFANIPFWIKEIWSNNGKGTIPLVLIGNNVELRNQSQDSISDENAEEYARKLSEKTKDHGFDIVYFPVSVNTGLNIIQAFEELARMYFRNVNYKKKI